MLQRLGNDFIVSDKSAHVEKRKSLAGLDGNATVTINADQIESAKDISLGYDADKLGSTRMLSKKDMSHKKPAAEAMRETDVTFTGGNIVSGEQQKVTVLQTTKNRSPDGGTPYGVTGDISDTNRKPNRDMTATYYGGHLGTFDGRVGRDLTLVQYSNSLRSNSKDSLLEKRGGVVSTTHAPGTNKTSIQENFARGGPLSQLHLMQRLHHQLNSLNSLTDSNMSAARRLADESLASIQNDSQIQLTHTGFNRDMYNKVINQPSPK